MTVTVTLDPGTERGLREQADQRGVQFDDYVRQVLENAAGPGAASDDVPIGQRLLDTWESDGVLGLFADRPDSIEFARQLRSDADNRR